MPPLRTYPLLLFLLLLFLLAGCCGKNDLSIAPSVKVAWIPYQNQQDIIFIGENNDTINFQAGVSTYFQENTDKACGPYHIQTEEVTFTTAEDPELRLVVSLSHEIVLNLKAFRINSTSTSLEAKFNSLSELYISHDWRDTYTIERTVNGRIFTEVLQVFGNQTPGPVSFSEILYARNKGLVGFKTFAGVWYFPG